MAVLEIIKYGDERLRTPSKEVTKVTSRIQKLIKDLIDTMYAKDGVGLAAPQVGENYRIFVIDTASGKEPPNLVVFINPKIVKKSGAINSNEGCLSFPNVYIDVRRYTDIIIRAKDEKGRIFTMEAKGGSLLARALQHETDHLDGIVFIDHSRNRFDTEQKLAEFGLPALDPEKLLDESDLEAEIQAKEVEEKEKTVIVE
ncbi:MAG: peptide deformylase [bacterium]